MTTPGYKMSDTVKPDTGEIAPPLSLPEEQKSAEIGDGTQKPMTTPSKMLNTRASGSKIGETSPVWWLPGKAKSEDVTQKRHLAEDVESFPGSEIGGGSQPPKKLKLAEIEDVESLTGKQYKVEIGERSAPLPPPPETQELAGYGRRLAIADQKYRIAARRTPRNRCRTITELDKLLLQSGIQPGFGPWWNEEHR